MLTSCVSLMCSCGKSNSESEVGQTKEVDYDTVIVAAGKKAAESALQYKAGSPERENAILAIRAAEYRLRQAGMNRSADSYVAGASTVLDTLSDS